MLDTISFVNDFVVAAGTESLATGIRNFIGPILLLIISIVAITFLFKREMTQFVIFVVIAIVVALLFYAPTVVKNLAQSANTATGQGGSWQG